MEKHMTDELTEGASCNRRPGRVRAATPTASSPPAARSSSPARSAGTRRGAWPRASPIRWRQALANIVALLAEAEAEPAHLVRLTWFVTDLRAYRENQMAIGSAYRRVIGKHFPAMSVIGVSQLVEPAALVEIEATAVLPRSPRLLDSGSFAARDSPRQSRAGGSDEAR